MGIDILWRQDDSMMRGWRSYRVEATSPRSFMVVTERGLTKVDRKTLQSAQGRGGRRIQFYTYETKDEFEFCQRNALNVTSAVSVCRDKQQLRDIAAILGVQLT